MNFHLVSLFPGAFDSYLNESILARAQKNKLITFSFYNPRDFVKPKKKLGIQPIKPYLRIDDKPYGGGPGMVMQAEPVAKAIDKILSLLKKKKGRKARILYLSPSGPEFTQSKASMLSLKYSDIIIICGRYEGIDARLMKIHKGIEFSIGPYVLTGGELPAMVMIDSIARHIKGVLGNKASIEESRISSPEVYTRPEVLSYKGKKYKVPKVLLSGHHKMINEWKIPKRMSTKKRGKS